MWSVARPAGDAPVVAGGLSGRRGSPLSFDALTGGEGGGQVGLQIHGLSGLGVQVHCCQLGIILGNMT